MKASLSNYTQSPRKVRLVSELVKGKAVDQAIDSLTFLTKRAALPVRKLIESAIANALSQGRSRESLVIKNITVDKGIVFRKSMPRARGRAFPIKRRRSHLNVELAVTTK